MTTSRGFTLVELLVALFVFALLAVAAYRGLNAVTETRAHLDRETRKWQALERFFARLDGEVGQALARPVRTANGTEQLAWVGAPSAAGGIEEVQLAFSRNGGFDTGGGALPPQRVGYRLRQDKVQLLRWPALDSAPHTEPAVDDVLEGVREFRLRFLSGRMSWEEQWPPTYADAALPRALEVELVLQGGEKIVRVFAQK